MQRITVIYRTWARSADRAILSFEDEIRAECLATVRCALYLLDKQVIGQREAVVETKSAEIHIDAKPALACTTTAWMHVSLLVTD